MVALIYFFERFRFLFSLLHGAIVQLFPFEDLVEAAIAAWGKYRRVRLSREFYRMRALPQGTATGYDAAGKALATTPLGTAFTH